MKRGASVGGESEATLDNEQSERGLTPLASKSSCRCCMRRGQRAHAKEAIIHAQDKGRSSSKLGSGFRQSSDRPQPTSTTACPISSHGSRWMSVLRRALWKCSTRASERQAISTAAGKRASPPSWSIGPPLIKSTWNGLLPASSTGQRAVGRIPLKWIGLPMDPGSPVYLDIRSSRCREDVSMLRPGEPGMRTRVQRPLLPSAQAV